MPIFIKTTDIHKHPTIFKTILAFKPEQYNSYSIHEVELKSAQDELDTQYFVFTLISGTSVMNWTTDDYVQAQNYLDIGTTQIFIVSSEGDEPVPVPDSYRN